MVKEALAPPTVPILMEVIPGKDGLSDLEVANMTALKPLPLRGVLMIRSITEGSPPRHHPPLWQGGIAFNGTSEMVTLLYHSPAMALEQLGWAFLLLATIRHGED